MSFFALIELLQNGPPPIWKPGVMTQIEFAEEVTRIHNELRRKHQAYALRMNEDLMNMSQQWSEELSRCQDLSHSGHKYKGVRVGENVTMKWTFNGDCYTPQEVCDQWYSEVRHHDFGTDPTVLTAGHFTQMVWRNSTMIGVGRAQARDGRSIVVVTYYPPGNVVGEFSMNVLPLAPHGDRSVSPVDRGN